MAIVLVSPLAWGHYFVLWLPAVLLVAPWIDRQSYPRAALILGAAPVVLTWTHYLAMRSCGPFGLLGLGTTAWFLVACGFFLLSPAWLGRDENRSTKARRAHDREHGPRSERQAAGVSTGTASESLVSS
jgi:hypothetical protein